MLSAARRTIQGWLERGPRCPICGGTRFVPFRGRANAECRGCGAKERQRLLALFLPHLTCDPRNGALPVVHFAPEPSVLRLLRARFPNTYAAADIDPARYGKLPVPVMQVDLTDPLAFFRPGSVAGFVHAHVLEHLPVPLDRVLPAMNACLAPGGFHLFQVPIASGPTTEDLSPDLSEAERVRRFGQKDHMRQIGRDDFDRDILRHFDGMDRLRPELYLTADQLERAGVPTRALTMDTGHTVYAFVKPG